MTENIYKPRPDCQIPGLEWIYCGVFGVRREGTFVEVGAHDGASWSNTVFLAELGWTGLYVEPIPELADRCRGNHKDHHNVTVAQYCIGDGGDVQMFRNSDTDYLFTGNEEFAKLNQAKTVIGMFQTVKLDDLLVLYGVPREFDLLVVDVEGMEEAVLAGFSLFTWDPKMVIIETHELNPNAEMAERTDAINQFFRFYMKIYTSAINTIFIRRDL